MYKFSQFCTLVSMEFSQSVLPGFSTALATGARKKLALLKNAQRSLLAESSNSLALLFSQFLPSDFLKNQDPTKRQRTFGHINTLWGWISQTLHANASCRHARCFIEKWISHYQFKPISSSTSAYCQARGRLQLDFIKSANSRLCSKASGLSSDSLLIHGRPLKAIDGSSLKLMDTPANQEAFPQPKGQKPGCGSPVMKFTALINLSHGGWEHLEIGKCYDHDTRLAFSMIEHIKAGDILLGDRAFCSYEIISRTCQNKADVIMRLHQSRQRALEKQEYELCDDGSKLMKWKKPARKPPGSQLSDEEWAQLPGTLNLRMVTGEYRGRNGKIEKLHIITSLLDTQKYDIQTVLDLYYRRWEIELKFRDVKTTLKMEELRVRSPEMAEKGVLVMVLTYNLLMAVMRESQDWEDVEKKQSLAGVLEVIRINHVRLTGRKPRGRSWKREMRIVLDQCRREILPLRPGRWEPRVVKGRPKTYRYMTKPRGAYHEEYSQNSS